MSENKQDTITVELPIEAEGEYVRVKGFCRLTREHWRGIASKPNYSGSSAIAFAPAVVAWIERDEFKPLDVPEAGREIRATLRNGTTVQFEVLETHDDTEDTWVYGPDRSPGCSIPKRFENDYLYDILAWEYVDEPKSFAEMTTTERLAWIEETRAWLLARAER